MRRLAYLFSLVALAEGCGDVLRPIPETGPPLAVGSGFTLTDLQRDIFTPRCALPNCHGSPLGGPMSLVDGETWSNVAGIPSVQVPSMDRIDPGAIETSYLLFKVRGTAGTVSGKPTRMPLNRAPLLDAEIERIEEWILAGALDN